MYQKIKVGCWEQSVLYADFRSRDNECYVAGTVRLQAWSGALGYRRGLVLVYCSALYLERELRWWKYFISRYLRYRSSNPELNAKVPVL